MRLLFSTLAAPQHLYPVVPLAWACRAAGHEVRIASAPSLSDAILHTGLPAVVVGRDIEHPAVTVSGMAASFYDQRAWPADWPVNLGRLDRGQRALLERLGRNWTAYAEAMVDDLVELGRRWRPDLVVHESVCLAGAVAAAALDVPDVRYLICSPTLPQVELRAARRGRGAEPLPEYARLFQRFGAEPRTTPALALDPCPPPLRYAGLQAGPCLQVRHVAYNGPGVDPGWLSEPRRRPRICVTWGHSVARAAMALGSAAFDPFREAVGALGDLDVDVVVATTAEQLSALGELPPNARAAESLPLQLALPHCDAIIHQTGTSTTFTAAAFGVPQLCITRKIDAALLADRLAATGAGAHLRYRALRQDPARREVIRSTLGKLLGDQAYRDAAQDLRRQIQRQPAPAEIVPELEALVAGEPAPAAEPRKEEADAAAVRSAGDAVPPVPAGPAGVGL